MIASEFRVTLRSTATTVAAFALCQLSFAVTWLLLHRPVTGERFEAYVLTALFYVPIFFAFGYGFVCLVHRFMRGSPRIRLGSSFWLLGLILGCLLGIIGTYTKVFWVLNPLFVYLGL